MNDKTRAYQRGVRRAGKPFLAALFLLIVLGMLFSTTGRMAMCAAPKPKKVDLYFHGSSVATKMNVYWIAKLTIKYDGKTVCENKMISRNSGFGGHTISNVKEKGRIKVHVKIYKRSEFIKSKTWERKFDDGKHEFNLEGDYWAFYMDLYRKDTDVKVSFE